MIVFKVAQDRPLMSHNKFNKSSRSLLLSLSLLLFVIATWSQNFTNSTLTYSRLRFNDTYLQIYRNFQSKQPYEEKPKLLLINETYTDSSGREAQRQANYVYWQEVNVDANNITRDKLILEALDRTYKTRLLPAALFQYDSLDDRRKSSDPALVSKSRCKRELGYLVQRLIDHQKSLAGDEQQPIDPSVAAFFDSYASEEPGLLLGNYHMIGAYEECQKSNIFDLQQGREPISFQGRHCFAALRSRHWEPTIERRRQELKDSFFKWPGQEYEYSRFFRIQVGICLPQSCDSTALYEHNETIRLLATHKLSEPVKSYYLYDLYCLPDETSELRKLPRSGWLLITLAALWMFAIISATLYDRSLSKAKLELNAASLVGQLTLSLSLRRNWERLTETNSVTVQWDANDNKPATATTTAAATTTTTTTITTTTTTTTTTLSKSAKREQQLKRQTGGATGGSDLSTKDLLFLNAFKVICTPMILMGHVLLLSQQLNRYPLDYMSIEHGVLRHFGINSVFYVDWYFVMTGFIASYTMFVSKQVQKNTLVQWIYSVVHRYWRIMPIYLLFFWFCRSIYKYTSYGPLWDYGTSNMTLRIRCERESWLYPLLVVPNWHPLHEECVMPAWYIGNDLQFYMVTPFLLVLMLRSASTGWLAGLGLISGAWAFRLNLLLTYDRISHIDLLRPSYDHYMRNSWDMHWTYLNPHHRIPSYLIGLLGGHYCYMVLSGQWQSPLNVAKSAWSRLLRLITFFSGLATVISLSVASMLLFVVVPESLERHSYILASLVYTIHHSMSALGLTMVFVSLIFGQFPAFRRLLSHPYWSVVSRINFFIYISQADLLHWLIQSHTQTFHLTMTSVWVMFFAICIVCYTLAPLVTLLIEMPLAQLEGRFLGVHFRPKRQIVPSQPNSSLQQQQQQQQRQANPVDGSRSPTIKRKRAAGSKASSSEQVQLVDDEPKLARQDS